jgi:hypothetical protein
MTPPEKYTISDLSDGDFFFYPEDNNCLYVKCTIVNDSRYYFALCMDTHNKKFGKVYSFNEDEEVIPVCNVELALM